MTIYRVGDQGATVFDEHGQPVSWLRPGQVVVAGSTELSESPAAVVHDSKRLQSYADKRLRVPEDKAR